MEESLSSASGPTAPADVARTVRVVDATDMPAEAWNDLTVRTPHGEAFQCHAWGEVKRSLGWTSLRYVISLGDRPIAAVSIQERSILGRRAGSLGRLRYHYAPRGPVLLDESDEAAAAALTGLRMIARRRHAVTLTIDPAWVEGGTRAATLTTAGFSPAAREIQVSRTAMIVPLQATEAAQHALLGDSTARNINKARRAGVSAERVDATDPEILAAALDEFFEMFAATGRREGFLVRDRDYELSQWRLLCTSNVGSLWFARVDGRRSNGVLVLHCGQLLVSHLAGSPDDADLRKTRANHLLQWEIVRWAAGAGFAGYDLGGVDTHDAPGFPADESHPLWNLYQFKAGFGARDVMRIPAHEYAPNRFLRLGWRIARRFR
jgi:peptidoglycan pentaglycine glycine transferase (the first glycine)